MLHVFPVATPVSSVLLAGNGYMYVISGWIFSIQIATGAVTTTGGFPGSIDYGSPARLEPNGKYFYTFSEGFSKWDITSGPAVSYSGSLFGVSPGSNGWLFQDGSEIIGGNGQVFTSSDVKGQDGQYIAKFSTVPSIQWAANSSALQSIAVIPASNIYPSLPDNQVEFFGDAYLGASGSILLPSSLWGQTAMPPTAASPFGTAQQRRFT